MSRNVIVKLLCALLLVTWGVAGHAGTIKTDIVMLVDESGSMGNGGNSVVHTNLSSYIDSFSDALATQGVEARFALIGFGLAGNLFRQLSDFGTADSFSAAAEQLSSAGNVEPVYDAMAFALDSLNSFFVDQPLSFAADAIKNFVLFTDEGDNSREFDSDAMAAMLSSNGVMLNAVLPVGSTTVSDFSDLALSTGGRMFDLNELETTNAEQAQLFLKQLGLAKAEETYNFCRLQPEHAACVNFVPPTVAETGTGALAVLLLAGLWLRRVNQR